MTVPDNSLISIVIPLYNKREAITGTLKSVSQQTYQNWECLIVNDGSTDDSVEFVKPFLANQRFRLIQKENGGVSSARNLGVEQAQGEYIIFLDADDLLLPKAIERLIETLTKYNTNIACGRACSYARGEFRRSFTSLRRGIIKDNFKEWVKGNYTPRTGCMLVKRDILLKYPNRTDLSRYEDAESLCNILRDEPIAYTPDFVFAYNCAGASLSRKACFERDFVSCLQFEGKSYWECVFLASIISDGITCYGEEKIRNLYAPYFIYLDSIKNLGLWSKRLRINRWIRLFEKLGLLKEIK